MKFVKVEWSPEFHRFNLDSSEYLAELPNLQAELPPGAWAYASDSGHFSIDYSGEADWIQADAILFDEVLSAQVPAILTA